MTESKVVIKPNVHNWIEDGCCEGYGLCTLTGKLTPFGVFECPPALDSVGMRGMFLKQV